MIESRGYRPNMGMMGSEPKQMAPKNNEKQIANIFLRICVADGNPERETGNPKLGTVWGHQARMAKLSGSGN